MHIQYTMKTSLICLMLATLGFSMTFAGERTPVEVVFVLDTTGSMGGLIAGAKEKIWSIASDITRQNEGASIKMGLVAYRDRGDDYITKVYDLTADLDDAYSKLRTFQAGGGGDAPESVNQALHEAVTKLSWSRDGKTLRLIFLVGDCPPHMDYQDDVKYSASCELAMANGIFINTVQCGNDTSTTPIWREISRLAEGSYAAIEQDGGMQVIETPYDADIAKISRDLDGTVIAYGSAREQKEVMEKMAVARSSSYYVQAERQAVNSSMGGRVVQGENDLVQEMADGNVKLKDVKEEALPAELKAMTDSEREAFIAKKTAEREQLNKQLADLSKKRSDYIAEETAKSAKSAKKSFDAKVSETITAQLAKINAK